MRNIIIYSIICMFLLSSTLAFNIDISEKTKSNSIVINLQNDIIFNPSNDYNWTGNQIFNNATFVNVTGIDVINESFYWNGLQTINTEQLQNNNTILEIKTSWLTTFIENIEKWINYYTKTEINNTYIPYENAIKNIDLNQKNISNITKTSYINSSFGVWSNETDIIFGYIGNLS